MHQMVELKSKEICDNFDYVVSYETAQNIAFGRGGERECINGELWKKGGKGRKGGKEGKGKEGRRRREGGGS